MTYSFRYSVWSAVSSDEQVTDHVSLENQIRDCREYAERLGGKETAGPYVADGYSRSYFEGLPEAMEIIPALKDAMLAADHNAYDVLFVRYFDRLGVLAQFVFIHLSKSRKQLISVQEAVPIMPPDLYNPAKDDTTPTMISIAGIKQSHRINRIINNLRDSMPKRIQDGLTPTRVPFAYTYVNNKTAPALDPTKAAQLIRARDLLMDGGSYTAIAKLLGIDRTRVPLVLGNQYYAGIVSYNKTYIQRLGNKRTQVKNPRSKWTVGTGKHTPIFTIVEHEDIVAELDRREQVKRRQDNGFVFAALLRCGVCGERARWHNFGSPGKYHKVVVCRVASARHIRHDYDHFFELVSSAIQREMARDHDGGDVDEIEDKADIIRQAIAATKNKRARVQDGFERGLYDTAEASARLRALEKDTERLHRDLEKSTVEKVSRRDAAAFMRDVDPALVPEWLEKGDTRRINRLLTAWLREIRVNVDGVELVKR